MLLFIVPLKSKLVSKDWDLVCKLLNRCLNSICNQTNSNFMVLVSCHEIPDTNYNNDSRIKFLQVDFPPPNLKKTSEDYSLKEADKGKKILFATEYSKNLHVNYVMTVDADDCISNKISEFVNKKGRDTLPGWYINKGYLYPEGKKYAYLNLKNFHTICGSCVIIKPELIFLMFKNNFWFDHQVTKFDNGIYLRPLPFPGALYSMLNGTNHVLDRNEMKMRTQIKPSNLQSIKTIFRRLGKYRIVATLFIRKEFNLDNI